ncbi:MAG: hypothetical protein JEZ06_00730 [Anaerolineaceae bacterium]|nr:hypothetical protein [Anaerolineaceae bacterium]
MKAKNILLLMIIAVLTACQTGDPEKLLPTGSPSPALPTLPGPQVNTTTTPDVQAQAEVFLNAWKEENYEVMYSQITDLSQDAISFEEFENRYREMAINITLQQLDYEIMTVLTNPNSAQVSFHTTYVTSQIGDLQRDMVLNLSLVNEDWRIQWEDGLILPELAGGNQLAIDYTIPTRGNIYDREGNTLVAQTEAVSLGVVPANISRETESRLIVMLAEFTGKTTKAIFEMYEDALGQDWYVPIGETTSQEIDERYDLVAGLDGLVMNYYSSRFHFDGGVAPHVLGHMKPIYAEELEEYRRLGYRNDDKVGASGLEKWAETYLAGKRGVAVYVTDPNGQVITRMAETISEPSQSVYTTFESDFQLAVQKSIEGFRGAVVVMERDTGRILAMASSPTFDSNLFDPQNTNGNYLLTGLFESYDKPLVNRATQGGYPLGSVFKVITMAAALESDLYTADTIYECGHEFTELPGLVLYDWTADYHGEAIAPSGTLTLSEGLMRSCNPYFYHIGLDLFRNNLPNAITDLSLDFGLGKPTGIGQIAEDKGSIPYPQTDGDAVQQAIGQGSMLVTPLQVAAFTAALGNGGTLYQPQVIEKIAYPDGEVTESFTPIETSRLPISEETQKILKDSMFSVVNNSRGTAYRVFVNFPIPIYAKTGTATNPFGDAHSWFTGYTNAPDTGLPDIAVTVIVENVGEGSDFAAPIFRRVVEEYYYGKPSILYPWETTFYVTQTSTPLPSATPTYGPSPTPEEGAEGE